MSVTSPAGFRAAGVAAGPQGHRGAKDVALVVNDGPRHDSATVFTANRCKANPVLWSQQVVKDGIVRAVVLNSGRRQLLHRPRGLPDHPRRRRAGRRPASASARSTSSSAPTGLIGLANDRDDGCSPASTRRTPRSPDGGATRPRRS